MAKWRKTPPRRPKPKSSPRPVEKVKFGSPAQTIKDFQPLVNSLLIDPDTGTRRRRG
jgi:hypothetical protein